MSIDKRGFLLASFVTSNDEEQVLNEVNFIVDNLTLTNQYIFLFQLVDEPDKKVLTYNILPEKGKPFNPRLFTMRIHRKIPPSALQLAFHRLRKQCAAATALFQRTRIETCREWQESVFQQERVCSESVCASSRDFPWQDATGIDLGDLRRDSKG